MVVTLCMCCLLAVTVHFLVLYTNIVVDDIVTYFLSVIYPDSPDQLPLSWLHVGWREFQVHFQRVQDQ